MARTLIQIYEIQTPREAEKLAGLGVDNMGGVLLPEHGAKNPVLRETAATCRELGARFSLIPLFSGPDQVCRALDYHGPDIVHFCDDLVSPDGKPAALDGLVRLQALVGGKFPQVARMRTLPVPEPGQGGRINVLALMEAFSDVTDIFLLDTWTGGGAQEPVSGFIGITGRACDWDAAAQIAAASPRPVILAGGLGPENVFEAVSRVRPAGVDSCTRTNALGTDGRPARFVKDREKVQALVQETRRAEKLLRIS